jgi:hypothetical protein
MDPFSALGGKPASAGGMRRPERAERASTPAVGPQEDAGVGMTGESIDFDDKASDDLGYVSDDLRDVSGDRESVSSALDEEEDWEPEWNRAVDQSQARRGLDSDWDSESVFDPTPNADAKTNEVKQPAKPSSKINFPPVKPADKLVTTEGFTRNSWSNSIKPVMGEVRPLAEQLKDALADVETDGVMAARQKHQLD